jgi:RNA methyltransferase, TrmH family
MIKNITSQHNPEIKNVLALKKSSTRKKEAKFFVDGQREIEIALKSGLIVEKLFFCSELVKKDTGLIERVGGGKVLGVSTEIFNKISYKENPDGFVAVFKEKKESLNKVSFSKNPIVVILESVEKPGNLGAIIRTSYAAGVDLIILNDNQTDIYNPNVIRASEGAVFLLPIINESKENTLKWLKLHQIIPLATTISQEAVSYYEYDFLSQFALILGSEAKGLSDFWLKNSQENITIPMLNTIDSLNVSVAYGIIIFEALRQRHKK